MREWGQRQESERSPKVPSGSPVRLHILSDLHIEVAEFDPPDTGAEVVVLAGDIHNGTQGLEWASRKFPGRRILYVPGNHEYYDGELGSVMAHLRARARELGIALLDNDATQIDGVRFLGATLWTDFCLEGAERRDEVMHLSRPYIVDFRAIRDSEGLFTPEASVRLHETSRKWLGERLSAGFPGPTVVITHHAPHPLSIHARFASHPANGGFVSDLEGMMGPAVLWIHGHTHNSFDYSVKGTRVVCNPRGYVLVKKDPGGAVVAVKAENADFDPALTVTL
jgi:predicted phosphodiesterase